MKDIPKDKLPLTAWRYSRPEFFKRVKAGSLHTLDCKKDSSEMGEFYKGF
jgi:hypothetical protein